MKIYVVTAGSYSEYAIVGIYSTKEKALEAKEYYATANEIEEDELDAPIPDHPPGTRLYRVNIERDGNIISWQHVDGDDAGLGWIPVSSYRNADGSPVSYDRMEGMMTAYFAFYVWAKDEKTAIKVANERRLACIADGRWTGVFRQDYARLEQERQARKGG